MLLDLIRTLVMNPYLLEHALVAVWSALRIGGRDRRGMKLVSGCRQSALMQDAL